MSKEEAIEILSEMRSEYNLFGDVEEATRYHVLSWAIKEMNAEPVVRCKDCRLCTVTELRELYCYRLEDIVGAEDYCSKGERREDAETN